MAVALLALCLLSAALFTPVAHAAWQPAQYSTQAVANSGDYGRWWQTWNSISGSSVVKINDVYVDNENRILSAGYIDSGSGSVDIYIARHDTDGTLLWEDTYDGGSYDEGLFITQDPGGNVLVAGSSDNGTSKETDVIVLKYALDGSRLWSQADTVTGSLADVRAAMGTGGEIYVAATRELDSFFNKDIVLLRFDTTGSVTWLNEFTMYSASTAGGAATVADMAVAPDGTIVIAGTSDEATKDIVVLKYNPDGTVPVAWQGGILSSTRYPDYLSANDYASALNIDAAGNIYVAGWTFNDCSGGFGQGKHNLIVMKLGADASLPSAWTQPACHISDLGFVVPRDIVTDTGGNTFVAGHVGIDIDADTLLVSFDAQGGKRWVRRLDTGGSDELAEMVLSPTGDVFAVGSGNNDALLVQYSTDGVLKSSFTEDYSSANDSATAVAIGQDSYGNPVVYMGGGSALDVLNQGVLFLRAYSEMRAELQATSVSAPAVGPFGGNITITNSVSNLQNSAMQTLANAGSFTVGLYLWPDGMAAGPVLGDPGLTFLGQRTVSSLQSGQQNSIDTVVTVPAPPDITAGQYHVVIIADINSNITEYDKANNILVDASIIDVFDPPDLQPLSVSAPPVVSAAATIAVDYSVHNNRSIPATGFNVGFSLSGNTTAGDGDDVQLQGTDALAGLAGNVTYNTTDAGNSPASVTIPNDITPGNYYLVVKADINDTVVEADESNNLFLNPVPINVQAIPDLTVQAASTTQLAALTGGPIDVDITVYNDPSGGDTTQDFTVSVYLFNATVTDQLVGSATTDLVANQGGSLGAGQALTMTVQGTVPAQTLVPSGSYSLRVVVDSANAVTESNEANNSMVVSDKVTIGVSGGDPDLMVTDVSLLSTPPVSRGSIIQVSTTVQNILPTNAVTSAFVVGIYLSTDPVITTADKRIGERTITSLAGTDMSTIDVTVPGDLVENIQWANVTNAHVLADNTLVSDSSIDSGASSVQVLSGDGAIETTVVETNKARYVGFSVTDNARDRSDFTHAFGLNSNRILYIWNPNPDGNPVLVDSGLLYNVGDVVRIERTAGVVRYRLNGTVIYTSSYASTGPVIADTAFLSLSATISNAKVIQVQLPAGTYYLGAIVDDTSQVTEVDESNNSQVQTDVNGAASSTVVSTLGGSGNSSSGGGVVSPSGLLLLLSLVFVWLRRGTPAPAGHQ